MGFNSAFKGLKQAHVLPSDVIVTKKFPVTSSSRKQTSYEPRASPSSNTAVLRPSETESVYGEQKTFIKTERQLRSSVFWQVGWKSWMATRDVVNVKKQGNRETRLANDQWLIRSFCHFCFLSHCSLALHSTLERTSVPFRMSAYVKSVQTQWRRVFIRAPLCCQCIHINNISTGNFGTKIKRTAVRGQADLWANDQSFFSPGLLWQWYQLLFIFYFNRRHPVVFLILKIKQFYSVATQQ